MSEATRSAATVRWHALTSTAAIVTCAAIGLGNEGVMIADPQHASTEYGMAAIHLGIAAPLWALVAWQLVLLRRRWPNAARGLGIGAIAAAVTAGAAIAAELASRWIERADAAPGVDRAAIAATVMFVAGIAWWIAVSGALAGIASRLAGGTLHLPTVRHRERALHLGTALRATPWSLLFAAFNGVLGHPVIGLVVAGVGVVAQLAAQLALADLLAKSRELAVATIAAARRT